MTWEESEASVVAVAGILERAERRELVESSVEGGPICAVADVREVRC